MPYNSNSNGKEKKKKREKLDETTVSDKVRQHWVRQTNELLRGDDRPPSSRRDSCRLAWLITGMYLLCGVGVVSSRLARPETHGSTDVSQTTRIQVGGMCGGLRR
ncbi:hypothetical protein ColTof3_07812 [Colletotrichum tofieldiae]|nr:hypothetical protein ColTof3_07812 [Colletotrichum tofieldiae]GKT90820.1 hypothetical protein Ct61P_08670 [Colletotrichum tofieldiae]